MASMSTTATVTVALPAGLPRRRVFGVASSPVLGLPAIGMKAGKVRCSIDDNPSPSAETSCLGMSASLVAAISAATVSSPAMALVDERMSTEGTGLPFGLSNNILGWLLLGVFALIWALYFTYTSGLDEDEESGLSL